MQLSLLNSLSGMSGLESVTYKAGKMPTALELRSLTQLGRLTSLVFDTWPEVREREEHCPIRLSVFLDLLLAGALH